MWTLASTSKAEKSYGYTRLVKMIGVWSFLFLLFDNFLDLARHLAGFFAFELVADHLLQLLEGVFLSLFYVISPKEKGEGCLLGYEPSLDTQATVDVVATTEILVHHETPSSLVPFDFVAVDS